MHSNVPIAIIHSNGTGNIIKVSSNILIGLIDLTGKVTSAAHH